MLTLKRTKPPVELADRAGDGLTVTLNWDRDGDGRLWVSVLHEDTSERFEIEAAPHKALDVFYHPFANCLPRAA
jgi:hypothetical protein